MKKALVIIRWVVGLLFIFSGLIKVNDPSGLSYKMQEFFEVWGIPFFNKFSLGLAIIMNTFEVSCGVALIIGFRLRFTIKLLLMLIVFFTFLTGYALLSGKIKTCGCLGDCLPLTPAMSFTKDLVLLALIVFLAVYQQNIRHTLHRFIISGTLMFSIIACIFMQDIVLHYLPWIDCLPFKVGNNIVEQMQKPKGYIPDSTVITYKYMKAGKEVEFDQSHFPDDFDSTYIYVSRFDKLVRKGTGAAKITDYNLITLSGNDTTQAILNTPRYLMVMGNEFPSESNKWLKDLIEIKNSCTASHIPFYYVTSQSEDDIKRLTKENITVLKCDATVIKTAARVNITYLLMNKATIINKYSYKDHRKILDAIVQLKNL